MQDELLTRYFGDLKKLCDEKGEVEDYGLGVPRKLSADFKKSYHWVVSFVETLEQRGMIVKTYGGSRGRTIVRIKLIGDPPRPRPVPAPPPIVQKKILPPLEVAPPTPSEVSKRKRVVMLVDYDNTVNCAEHSGYQLSFARLRDYARTLGVVAFAEAFVSPRSRQDRIGLLWKAGFRVILCPMAYKDKDAVDNKLKTFGRQIGEHATCETIVVVSEDRDLVEDPDFTEHLKDLGKEVLFVSVSKLKKELEGTEQITQDDLPWSPDVQRFIDAIPYIQDGVSGLSESMNQHIHFLKEVIGVIDVNTRGGKMLVADAAKDLISHSLRAKCPREMLVRSKQAVTALRAVDALRKTLHNRTYYFELNRSHHAIKRFTGDSAKGYMASIKLSS